MSVITNSLAMMDTSSTITSLDADAVVYDNTTSGLTATDAQAAIDELDNTIDTISTEIGSLDAADVGYSKTIPNKSSGQPPIAITDVQEAFDYLLGMNGAYPVPSTIVNYQDCTGSILYSPQSVSDALREVDNVLSDFLEATGSGGYILPADNVKIDNEQSGVYEQAQTVQDALSITSSYLNNGELIPISSTSSARYDEAKTLNAVLTIIDNALDDLEQGGGSSVIAGNVTYNGCGGFWSSTSVSNVEEGLNYIGQYLDNLSPSGGSVDADDVSFDGEGACWAGSGSSASNVYQALDYLYTIMTMFIQYDSEAEEYSIDSSNIAFTPCGGVLLNHNINNVDSALQYLSEYVDNLPSGGGGASDATDVSYTKPQNSIYGSNTDTVKEALDDVSTVIQALDSTDIAIPAASKTGIYANTATVQQALDAIKTAISSGGGGGSSSASSVSFTKPQGGIYSSGTDTVQEALEDVNYKIIYLKASDIGFLGSGCGGGYPTGVETVQDALNALEHLLYKYSEFEKETGLLWFNDKPIYQVSVEVESGTTNLFDTNELEIDDLVYMEATLTDSSGTKRWTISGSSGELYWDTATHMIVYGGSDVITTATIRYTKTSD